VGGNLGIPLSEAVGGDWDIGVVEVSSYQLELPGEVAPPAAVWLNLTPDHLTRHGDMAGYAAAKAALFTRQQPTDLALLGPGAHIAAAMADAPGRRVHLGQGVRVVGRRAEIDLGAGRVSLDLSRVSVPGRHNLEHAATAAALCLEMGVPVEALAAGLAELEALPHRMQPVATRDDVVWIDDSKATNIASASVAIRGLDRAAVVLLGGRSKGPGFAVLADDLRRHRAVLAFGEAGADIAAELVEAGLGVERVDAMETAMQRAAELAQPGDAVLLSPACSSFDAYDDFAHRGRRFTELARGGMP
jgi:UDP-N-acetylmuramoylalanine--D-glutamate ligase